MTGARDGRGSGLPRIAVVMGGPSAEHDVSLVSGRAIADALAGAGYSVDLWLIALDLEWWALPASAGARELPTTAFDEPRALGADGPLSTAAAIERIASREPRPVVFIALHGPFGEDGTMQALCEGAGLTYTGAGVTASALGMDKVLFKRLVGGLGIPVVPWRVIDATTHASRPDGGVSELRAFSATLPDGRVIVKPARLGSSVGISIVHDPGSDVECCDALDRAFRYDDVALVEAYVAAAREFEVSVVGNDAADVAVYGPGEIFPGNEFYDYVAKYAEGVSRTTDRPELPGPMRETIRRLARDAYLAIGASGFARVDFLVGGDAIYVSEINTIPGFTPISLFPVLCREGGYDFAGISSRIVELAVARAAGRPVRRLTRADLP